MPMEVDFPDDLLSELIHSADTIAEDALNAAGPVLAKNAEAALQKSVASRGKYSKGVMVPSVKATKAKRTKTDALIVVARPTGKDSKGVRNALKAGVMEYGSAHEAPRPWVTRAAKDAENEAIAKMQDVINKKAGAE